MKISEDLKIRVLDVGHGDSIVIEFPNSDSFGIVDCNRHSARATVEEDLGGKVREPKALGFLREEQQNGRQPVVEFICLTHPHFDHYNGLAELINGLHACGIQIREYWDYGLSAAKAMALIRIAHRPEQVERAREMEKLCLAQLELIEHHKCRYRILSTPCKRFWTRHNVHIEVLAPDSSDFTKYGAYLACSTESERRAFSRRFGRAMNANVVSSALRLSYGSSRVVLGGDVENDSWSRVLSRDGVSTERKMSCGAMKVSHHGSFEGNFPLGGQPLSDYFDSRVTPLSAVISGGYRYGLPHQKTLKALAKGGCLTYCTGSIPQSSPYLPAGLSQNALDEVIGEMLEIPESTPPGNGDVTILLSRNGDCRITPEFEFSPYDRILL